MITPDNLLHQSAVRDAIHSLYSLEYPNVIDEYYEATGNDGFCHSGDLFTYTRRLPDEVAMHLGWYLVGRVEQVWGHPVGLVFHHAGIQSEKDQSHALSDLFLGIQGHGVTLEDDYSGHIANAEMVLGRLFKSVPFSDEMSWLREIAEEEFKKEKEIDIVAMRDSKED